MNIKQVKLGLQKNVFTSSTYFVNSHSWFMISQRAGLHGGFDGPGVGGGREGTDSQYGLFLSITCQSYAISEHNG